MSKPTSRNQPKSPEAIRAKIEAMQQHYQSDAAPGDHSEGVPAADRIHIASFYSANVCAEFQHELTNQGIMSSSVARNRQTHVSVDYEDRDRANEVVAVFCRMDERPTGFRRDFEFLVLGAVLGITIALVVLVGARQPAVLAPYAGAWALVGGLLGHMADRVRGIWRTQGRLRLGVREYLLLMAICAIAVWMPYYAAAVLNN